MNQTLRFRNRYAENDQVIPPSAIFGTADVSNRVHTPDSSFVAFRLRMHPASVGTRVVNKHGEEIVPEWEWYSSEPGTAARVILPLPTGASHIELRNTNSSSAPSLADVFDGSYTSFSNLYDQPLDYPRAPVFILGPGKTGSISLERALVSCGDFPVIRAHEINYPAYAAAPSHDSYAASLFLKLSLLRFLHAAQCYGVLMRYRRRRLPHFIVVGLRHPSTAAVSAFFENFGMSHTSLSHSDVLKACLNMIPDLLYHINAFYTFETMALHNLTLDLLTLRLEKHGLTWGLFFPETNAKMLFYRIEDGSPAIQEVVQHITGISNVAVPIENSATSKEYASVYEAIKREAIRYTSGLDWGRTTRGIYNLFYNAFSRS